MEDVPDRPAQRKRHRSTMITVDLGDTGRSQLNDVLEFYKRHFKHDCEVTISYAIRAAVATLWLNCCSREKGVNNAEGT
jgi:hypothetical protein